MKRIVIAAALLLAGCASSTTKAPREFEEELYSERSMRTVSMPYLVFWPGYFESGRRYPLVIFLHGSGQAGYDLSKVGKGGLAKLARDGRRFPFFLVCPQSASAHWWNTDDLDQFLGYVLKTYPQVDPDRVILTGNSLGGYGAWDWAEKRPDHFAAIVPIAGGGDPTEAERLKSVAVWAFHGDKDTVVPVSESVRMVEAVKQAGGDARLTVYPGVAHNSWTKAYGTTELYEWMLGQRRKSAKRLEE